MAKNLVFFSGGLDSTYLAYKFLTETTDDITLSVMVDEHTQADGLQTQKVIAIQSIITELKKIRNFIIDYKIVDKNLVTSIDNDNWWNYAIEVYKNDFDTGIYDNFVTGTSHEQNDGYFCKNRIVQGVRSYFEAKHNFETNIKSGTFFTPLVSNFFHEKYSYYHALKFLPEEIKVHTIGCFNATNCNTCAKCLYRNKIEGFIASGWTADNVDDWRKERNMYYGGSVDRDCNVIHWIKLENNISFSMRGGISNGLNNLSYWITNKQEFDVWYDTIEYFPRLDYTLKKWGLDKTGWNPPLLPVIP